MSSMTHGSLFSGVGGFDLGAQMSGIKTIWNCECEEHKRNILKCHFPDAVQFVDVCAMIDPPCVDIISGGFPCQDISIANVSNKKLWEDGKVKGINGERSGLWKEYKRIVGQIRPKFIVFENSPMLTIRGFEQVLCDLTKSGYDCQWQCYRLHNLVSIIRENEFTVLPTPSKSDAKIILRSSAQYKKYYMRGHQDKALYQFQLNGLTANQAMIMYEWMMGFPVNWTKEE